MTNTEKKNVLAAGKDFFGESVDELKKVHTPSKQEVIQGTIGVVVMVLVFGLFLGLADLSVGKLMQWLLAA